MIDGQPKIVARGLNYMRQLEADCKALKALNSELVKALDGLCGQDVASTAADWDAAWSTARAVLAKAKAGA